LVSTPAAEWLIARFTNKEVASSMAGDLLEEAAEGGRGWFWGSVAGIVLWLNRRRLLAFFVALECSHFLRGLPMPVFAVVTGRLPAPQPRETWFSLFAVLGWIAMLSWVAAPYLMVRYGVRDRFAQLALGVSLLVTTADMSWQRPAIAIACIAVAAAILIGSALFARWRGPSLAVVIAVLVGYAGFQVVVDLAWRFLNLAPPSVTLSAYVNDLVPVCAAATLTVACGWLHSILTRQDHRNATTEFPQ
jgi:hypothetical protein